MKRLRLASLLVPVLVAIGYGPAPASAATGAGVGSVPQGTQDNWTYANSYAAHNVTNVFATTQQTSCYTPEVPYSASLAPNDGYTGESACVNKRGRTLSTTGEDLGPYPTQAGSNPGSPAATPMLVKDHSESDIRVDPTNPQHLIGSSKWVVSAEGYNHLLGFYESFDGGKTWPVQGHIPGYEGWTENTDPVGEFDGFGNYYEFNLPYEFFYNADGSHNYKIGTSQEPNPVVPAEAVSISVRPHGSTTATQWLTTHNGHPDYVATYDAIGNEPDKQWLTIDNNPKSPFYNRVYTMWVDFHHATPQPFVSYAQALPDGTHTDWSVPDKLPFAANTPQGATYLLPHVDPSGVLYTTLTNFTPQGRSFAVFITLDKSTDGGVTWKSISTVVGNVTSPPLLYANTGFRDGIENTLTVGPNLVKGNYPLYVSWEDYSAGVGNLILSASYDGGKTWSAPIQVNDNATPVDAFQPNLTAAANGTVSVAFYDRRLACPAQGTPEAVGAGLALDQVNDRFSGSLPPYGALNYCVNASIQFYKPDLTPIGHNVRISQRTWDPQLNEPRPSRIGSPEGFIGDYYGNVTGVNGAGVLSDYTTSTSTYNDGSNPNHYQQQVIATIAVP